jgi:hypothetical protein
VFVLERKINLFIALLISLLFIYLPTRLGNPNIEIFQLIPFVDWILGIVTELIFDILQLIGVILFLKVAYLWIKEIWRFK